METVGGEKKTQKKTWKYYPLIIISTLFVVIDKDKWVDNGFIVEGEE